MLNSMMNRYACACRGSTFCRISILVMLLGSHMQVSVSQVTVDVKEWVDIQESTVMTCSESAIAQLEWISNALDAGSSAGGTLIYIFSGGTTTPGTGIDASRYEFDGSGNFPLTIKSVELADESRYWCKIIGSVGPAETSGPLRIRVPVGNSTNISYNENTYTGNEGNIDILAGTQDATFDCTAPGIKPGATVFVWTLDDTTVPSTGPPTQSPNGVNDKLTDSTSTLILNITDDFSKPLRLCCATTNRQDGSSETEASICVTLNLTDPCQKISCENGGTCANENGKPKCHCTDEFTGDTCSEKVPTTSPEPTQPTGTDGKPTEGFTSTVASTGTTGFISNEPSTVASTGTTGFISNEPSTTPELGSTVPSTIGWTTSPVPTAGGLGPGEIAVICIGAGALVAIVTTLILCFWFRKSCAKHFPCLADKSAVGPADKEALEMNGGTSAAKEKEG